MFGRDIFVNLSHQFFVNGFESHSFFYNLVVSKMQGESVRAFSQPECKATVEATIEGSCTFFRSTC